MELYTKTSTKRPEVEITTRDFEVHGVQIPSGFSFDGASAPRIFWAIIPPFKRTKKAACVHDWLCRNAKGTEDRKVADKLFYEMLLEVGLSRLRARLGYLGVRLGALFGSGVYYPHWTNRRG